MTKSKLSHKRRLELFDEFIQKKNSFSMIELKQLFKNSGATLNLLYRWNSGEVPFGRKGEIIHNASLYYVIGALLGDGCLYRFKPSRNDLILVGDSAFCEKYYFHLLQCSIASCFKHPDRTKNTFNVKTNNYQLAELFDLLRTNVFLLKQFLKNGMFHDRLQFLEGFFDAEGCVKIINDKARKIPKICLDICNTRKEWLDCCQMICEEVGIRTNFSNQEAYLSKDGYPRKKSYHLRVYQKASVSLFFLLCKTTKLNERKEKLLWQWLLHRHSSSSGKRHNSN